MRTQIINTAAVIFSVFMLSSCDKESLVPISDVTESSAYFKEKVVSASPASDHEKAYYNDPEAEEKTFAEGLSKADYDKEYARQGDESHSGLEDPEAIAKTSANSRLSAERDDSALQSNDVLFGVDDPEAVEKTAADSRLTKKDYSIDALESDRIQTLESKKDNAGTSLGKESEVNPNAIKTNAGSK